MCAHPLGCREFIARDHRFDGGVDGEVPFVVVGVLSSGGEVPLPGEFGEDKYFRLI